MHTVTVSPFDVSPVDAPLVKNRYTIAHKIKPITNPIISPVKVEFLFIFCIGFTPIMIPPCI